LRKQTLNYLEEATVNFKNKTPKELAELKVIFERGEKQSSFPFWNMINGPLADAIYHTGQVVSFRRSSGNPLPKGVNVFMGKTKE
jgi:sorbitol-specific phosphotransferase system component IIA